MASDQALGGEEPLARWSPLRTKDAAKAETLRIAAKDIQGWLQGPGWAYVQNWLAVEQQKELKYLLMKPGDDPADVYALRKAHAAGVLQGLKIAYDTPNALLRVAEQVAEQQQRDAEMAEQEGNR